MEVNKLNKKKEKEKKYRNAAQCKGNNFQVTTECDWHAHTVSGVGPLLIPLKGNPSVVDKAKTLNYCIKYSLPEQTLHSVMLCMLKTSADRAANIQVYSSGNSNCDEVTYDEIILDNNKPYVQF